TLSESGSTASPNTGEIGLSNLTHPIVYRKGHGSQPGRVGGNSRNGLKFVHNPPIPVLWRMKMQMSVPLKLLLVCPPTGVLGGGHDDDVMRLASDIAGELARRGMVVHVLAPEGSRLLDQNGAKIKGPEVIGVPGALIRREPVMSSRQAPDMSS